MGTDSTTNRIVFWENLLGRHGRLITLIIVVILLFALYSLKGDFTYQYNNWQLSLSNDVEFIYQTGNPYQTVWPPFFQWVTLPLGKLPFAASKFIWELAMIFGMLTIFHICRNWIASFSRFPNVITALVVLLTFRFWLGELKLHQQNGIMLAFAIAGIYLVPKKPWLAGLLLAASVNLKAVTIIFLPYFLVKRHFRATAWFAFFLPILGIIFPASLWGLPRTLNLWKLFHENRADFLFPPGAGAVQGLGNALRSFLTEGPFHTSFFDLGREQFIPILVISYALVGLFALGGIDFKSWDKTTFLQKVREIAIALLVMNLVSPVTRKAHLVAMTPAVFFVVYLALERKLSRGLWGLAGIYVLFIPLTGRLLWGIELWKFLLGLHLLTFGYLALLGILVFSRKAHHTQILD